MMVMIMMMTMTTIDNDDDDDDDDDADAAAAVAAADDDDDGDATAAADDDDDDDDGGGGDDDDGDDRDGDDSPRNQENGPICHLILHRSLTALSDDVEIFSGTEDVMCHLNNINKDNNSEDQQSVAENLNKQFLATSISTDSDLLL